MIATTDHNPTPMHHHFADQVTVRDSKRHLPHHFNVPEGSTQLTIHFQCEQAAVNGLDPMLTLSLFDTNGFRGARHRGGSRHVVTIDAEAATPGYLPGPLPAGKWLVQVDAHRIVPGATLHYTLDIEIGTESPQSSLRPLRQSIPGAVVRTAPGWYRGDLHSHTNHSDAGDRSVSALIEEAKRAGLDFLFLTDHNTIAPLAEMDMAASHALLTAGGMELTTFWGHALVLGGRHWIDWRFRPGDGAINRLADDVYANQNLFVMAHPASGGDPDCTGCAWRFGEMMPGAARIIEIWNGPWAGDSNNETALALYYDWLNQGRRLVATAGSDTHSAADYAAGPGFSIVYAEELSEPALLRAIAAGHLYLSSGPQLMLAAQEQDGRQRIMGDAITQPAEFSVRWQDCPDGALLRIVVNGQLLHQQAASGAGTFAQPFMLRDANWLNAEIRSREGLILAITNPIFFGD